MIVENWPLYLAPLIPFALALVERMPVFKKRAVLGIVLLVVGLGLAWSFTYKGIRKAEIDDARYYVATTHCAHLPKNSREVQQSVDKYVDAKRRAKEDGRGVPIIRDDCSVGVDWSININELLGSNTGR